MKIHGEFKKKELNNKRKFLNLLVVFDQSINLLSIKNHLRLQASDDFVCFLFIYYFLHSFFLFFFEIFAIFQKIFNLFVSTLFKSSCVITVHEIKSFSLVGSFAIGKI